MDGMNILRTLVLGLCLQLLSYTSWAQSERAKDFNQNGWYRYFGDHKLNSKWGLHTEVRRRRHNMLKDPQQLLTRTGIN